MMYQPSTMMMEAVRTSETSVDNLLHGSTSQKTILFMVMVDTSFGWALPTM